MYFALARWQWLIDDLGPHWGLPDGATASIDIRERSARITVGGTGAVSLFGYDVDPSGRPEVVSVLGDDPQGRLRPADKAALEDALGLTALGLTLDAVRVGPCIWEGLTRKADPTGLQGPRPIMPNRRLRHRLVLGDIVHDVPFDLADPDLAPNVLAVLKADYRRYRRFCLDNYEVGDRRRENYRRVLGHWVQRKFRVGDYRQFQDSDLPDEEPLDPETTLSDSFTYSDGELDTVSSGAWVSLASNDWEVSSGAVDRIIPPDDSWSRFDSALSSDDHDVQLVTTPQVTAWGAPMARFSNTADDGYIFIQRTGDSFLQRVDAGIRTDIGGGAGTGESGSGTAKVETDGSAIEGFWDGASKRTATDTNITGNLYGGIHGRADSTGIIDDWQAADLAAGGGVTTRSVTDGLFVDDTDRRQHTKFFTEGLLIADEIRRVMTAVLDDGLLLDDATQREFRLFLSEGLDLDDARISELLKLVSEGLLIGDDVTTQKVSGEVRVVTRLATDGLLIGDNRVSELRKRVTEGVETDDTVARVIETLISDAILLGDTDARTTLRLISDELLLGSDIAKQLVFLLSDGLFFRDTSTATHVTPDAQALVFASLDAFSLLGERAGWRSYLGETLTENDFLGVETRYIVPQV